MRDALWSREYSTGHSPFSQSTGPRRPPLWHRMHVLCDRPRRSSASRSCCSTRSQVCDHLPSSSVQAAHRPGSLPGIQQHQTGLVRHHHCALQPVTVHDQRKCSARSEVFWVSDAMYVTYRRPWLLWAVGSPGT